MTHFLPGAATASQQVTVIATWPDFVLLIFLLWTLLCLCSLHDKCLLSWPPLKKAGCQKHDSRTSEQAQAAFQTDAGDPCPSICFREETHKFKPDLEFLSVIWGVNKMTRYFCSTLTLPLIPLSALQQAIYVTSFYNIPAGFAGLPHLSCTQHCPPFPPPPW